MTLHVVLVLGSLVSPPAPPASPAPSPAVTRPSPAPSPSPVAPRVLEGVVTGPDGKPVKDARVTARPASLLWADPPLFARTDEGGRFRLALRDRSVVSVRVEAADLAPVTLTRVAAGAPLRITLARGGLIEGVVKDGQTGAPLAGARVEAAEEGGAAGLVVPWDPDSGRMRARTDAQGRFRLAGVGSRLQSVSAVARGYGRATRRSVRAGARADLLLFPGASIVGSVRGPSGEPVAGARIVVEALTGYSGMGMRTGLEASDASGRFEILGLAPGTYRLSVRHPDLALGWTGPLSVERGGETAAEVTLDRPRPIVGHVVDPSGRPLPARVSVAETDGQAVPTTVAQTLATEAAPDGTFRLPSVPTGAHVLQVSAPGFAIRRVEVEISPAARVGDAGEIVLETGLQISGRVLDRARQPVAGAQVTTYMRLAGGDRPPESRTEADGTFVVGGLKPGTYEVFVRAPGYGPGRARPQAGGEPVEIVLQAAGSVTGSVVDEGGRPVDAFRVSVTPVSSEMDEGPGFPASDTVGGGDGRFTLADVAPGTYTLEVAAPDRAPALVSGVKVASGTPTDVGIVKVAAGGIVRGTVVDATGAAVAGATITVQGISRPMTMMGAPAEALSDASGAFEMRGVASGTVRVVARHPSFAEGRVSTEVDAAKGPSEVRITLAQGGRIEGRAVQRDGRPFGGSVRAMSRSGGPFAFSSQPPVALAPDGTFAIEHVAAGPVDVYLMQPTGTSSASASASVQSRQVEVREGETTTVEFVVRDILVHGRVTRGGAPLAGVRITLRLESVPGFMSYSVGGGESVGSGPPRGSAVTREDGSYELLVSGSGKGTAMVASVDGASRWPARPIEIPDADAHTLDVDFATAALSGIVVDGDTEQPVKDAGVFASAVKPAAGVLSGGSGTTGPDGRFRLEVDPGEYRVGARAERYSGQPVTVTVGEAGTSDVRIALVHGLAISGRVVDAARRPVAGAMVFAMGGEAGGGGMAMSEPDGSYRVEGLTEAAYDLSVRTEFSLFAARGGVRAGATDVVLTLRPGGRVAVRVLGPDGGPVSRAGVGVVRANGIRVSGMGVATDAQGMAEIDALSGEVELRAATSAMEGKATVSVIEGGTAAVEIRLQPRAGGR